MEPSKESDTVLVGVGGGLGVNYGSEPGAKQIAIWLTVCKSKFPEPLCMSIAF